MSRTTTLAIFTLLLAGCAQTSSKPVSSDHPANPDASAAPMTSPTALATTMPATTRVATTQPLYVCPMHAEVTSDKPGRCPKCGMQLVKKEKRP